MRLILDFNVPCFVPQAKAFDKKTSVLMYLAKLVKKNDESLLGFQEDLTTVRHAENIILDSLASDIKAIEADLEKVHETAASEAARLEAAGELKPFSLSDLKELKTSVYTIENVPHFNKVDHHSGRTPMERFSLNSQDALKQATKKIDVLKRKYRDLLMYFGEDEKMPSNEFFGVMRRFVEEFEKACDQVEKLELARVRSGVVIESHSSCRQMTHHNLSFVDRLKRKSEAPNEQSRRSGSPARHQQKVAEKLTKQRWQIWQQWRRQSRLH